MMQQTLWIGVIMSVGLLGACSSTPPVRDPGTILPLLTVRFCVAGVGYFERRGSVSPSSGTALSVAATGLDDALKTLVVMSKGRKSRVDGLQFDSAVTEGLVRALAGLSKEAKSIITYMRLLSSLEGEKVEV